MLAKEATERAANNRLRGSGVEEDILDAVNAGRFHVDVDFDSLDGDLEHALVHYGYSVSSLSDGNRRISWRPR